uniref:alpha-amylase family glycosyl hydrolase n=1 Tax=Flavobacterium sp. TaxID=239 RepID=UPI00404A041E
MKKFLSILILLFSVLGFSQITVTPSSFEVTDQITISVSLTPQACNSIPANATKVYMHAGIGDDNNAFGFDVVGNWGQDDGVGQMTNSGGSFSITITPSDYFDITPEQQANVTKLGMVFRTADGTGELKKPMNPGCGDFIVNVGTFQVNLTSPVNNSTTLLASGSNFNIAANNTGGNASYVLKSNGVEINSNPSTANYVFNQTNITSNQNYDLEVTQDGTTISRNFSVVVNPVTQSQAMPANLVDGVNYGADQTKATLVLNAPFKDFIYVAGSFNNWQPSSAFAMKKDPASGKFWLELTNLTPNQMYAYQYWVGDQTDLPANSPALVKTADPFSTLVFSPFDDQEIIDLGVYPDLPSYNDIAPGQSREVTALQTGDQAYYQYQWSDATLNFQKPAPQDLVIYEALVRDFDANRTYQDLIDKIDYFVNLKINALQLMPVMEFEGNLSWGYNTVFHMAADKRYGSPAKLKELVDLCHQNGIAVILDLALNHVYGRSPLERMWMLDSDGDGWANDGVRVSAENPYCNQNAMHSYSVGTDLDHFREPENLTNTYSVRTIEYWINEYKIDGYRWDLTKGITNSCPPGGSQEGCTNGYHADRVAKLKYYADVQWAADPNFLVIFEHLGNGGSFDEEVEWANYRLGEGKGIMPWRKMTDPYANLIKGNSTNLSGVAHESKRFVGYAESQDEERVVYKAINEAGQTQNNLTKAIQRLPAQGAVHLLVPGPKMLWHFGELGWELSLWTCTNGNVSFNNPDCKLDTKPQPQWEQNWMNDVARMNVYNAWARMNDLKINNDVFSNGNHAWNFNTVGRPRLDVWTSTAPQESLSYVFVLTNFTDNVANIPGGFPYAGEWTNMMDNSSVNVSDTNMNIQIEANGYRVFGNKPYVLSNDGFDAPNAITLYPNPASNQFILSGNVSNVEVFALTGRKVKSFNGDFQAGQIYDVNDIQNGVYLVRFKTESQKEHTLKLVIK